MAAALGVDLEGRATRAREPLYAVEVVPGQRLSPFVDLPRGAADDGDGESRAAPARRPASLRSIDAPPRARAARRRDAIARATIWASSPTTPSRSSSAWPPASASSATPSCACARRAPRKPFLPVDEAISVYRLLGDYVELQDVATRSQIQTLVEHTECPWTRPRLAALAGDDEASAARYKADVMAPRKSLVDLLEEYPACALPFSVYLEMLSPLAPRYYSISSSPLARRAPPEHHRGRRGCPRPLRSRHLPRRVLELPAPSGGGRASSTRS